jgi:methionine-rich copper-binding protein CopC
MTAPRPAPRALLWIAGAALSVALLAWPACPAGAHALVIESEPAKGAALARPPAHVRIRFNSKIERRLSRLSLERADGRRVPLPLAEGVAGFADRPDHLLAPLPEIPAGRYVIRWRVLAADGHITEGAIRFTVADP